MGLFGNSAKKNDKAPIVTYPDESQEKSEEKAADSVAVIPGPPETAIVTENEVVEIVAGKTLISVQSTTGTILICIRTCGRSRRFILFLFTFDDLSLHPFANPSHSVRSILFGSFTS